jgi:hypothetical protein
MMFKIEKGVQLASVVGRYSDTSKWPFDKMEVGDSFFVPIDDSDWVIMSNRLASTIWFHGKQNGMKFAQRKVEGGRRVWRVS